MAKIALQTTVDAAFSEKYSGTLSINSVKLSKAASQSPVIARYADARCHDFQPHADSCFGFG